MRPADIFHNPRQPNRVHPSQSPPLKIMGKRASMTAQNVWESRRLGGGRMRQTDILEWGYREVRGIVAVTREGGLRGRSIDD